MQKFFFHVRQGDLRFEDTHGAFLTDLTAAWQRAVKDAQEIADQHVLDGILEEQWMEIGDESGAVVGSIPFSHALRPN